MKILVLNGSPKGEKSDCLRLTRAFLEGMGEEATFVDLSKKEINPCVGCFTCWGPTGLCPQKDDAKEILDAMVDSDLVIFSMPLYCYGMPSKTKALVDRTLSLTTRTQKTAEDGSTYHPTKREKEVRFMLISGCGFANIEHNYEGLVFQFGMCFGDDFPRILCAEAPLLNIPEAAPIAEPYLALCKQAGAEFAANGVISKETQEKLDAPMYPPEMYRNSVNRG